LLGWSFESATFSHEQGGDNRKDNHCDVEDEGILDCENVTVSLQQTGNDL
jgi:hypothetical protein